MNEIEIKYKLNPDEVERDSNKIDKVVERTATSYIEAGDDIKSIIATQKSALKDLEKQFKELEKQVKKAAPGAVQEELKAQVTALRSEIEIERMTLADLTLAEQDHARASTSLRTQIMELRNAMAKMVEGTEQYATAQQKLGELMDKYGDINQQGRVFADDERHFRATTEAIQGLSGVMSTTMGISALLGVSQENLTAIQTKLQAVMAISIGVQQVAQVLNKDSYFTLIILGKAKDIVAAATTRLSVALGVSNLAAKALLATLTLGLTVAITGIVWLINKISVESEKAAEKQKELKEQNEAWGKSVADNATKQIVSYTRLCDEYNRLGDNIKAKEKFIKDAKKQFDDLGVGIGSVSQAEEFFNKNTNTVIGALMSRAKAAAALKLAEEQYAIAIAKGVEKENLQVPDGIIYSERDIAKVAGSGFYGLMFEAPAMYDHNEKIKEEIKEYEKIFSDLDNDEQEASKKAEQYFKMHQSFTNEAVAGLAPYEPKSTPDGNKNDTSSAKNQLIRNAKDRQLAIAQAEIDAMAEGSAKKLAQLDLDHQKEMSRLSEQKAETLAIINSIRKANGEKPLTSLPGVVASDFAIIENASKTKSDKGRAMVMKAETDEIVKVIEGEEQALTAYLAKYGTYEQQRLAITIEYQNKILNAKSDGARLMAEKEQEDALKALDINQLAKASPFKTLFEDLGKFDISTITNSIDSARKMLDQASASGKYTATDLEAMYAAVNKAEAVVRERNPFVALSRTFKEWKAEPSKENFKELAGSASSACSLASSSLSAVSGGLKGLGISMDEGSQEVLDGVISLLGGASDLAAGIATGDPSKIIQGAITTITSLFTIFDSRTRDANATIKDAQTRIDLLKDNYDDLGRAVEKAYSGGASALIEDQNKILEQQKQLIQNQIDAEKSKKNGGDAKQIKEWEKSIKDIDLVIEDNKDKAIDAIFGSNVQTAIDNLASAYMNAWDSGEDRAAAQKDVVRKMIQGIVTEIIKGNIADKVAKLRETLKSAIVDGVISDTEQTAIDRIQDEIYKQSERDAAAFEKYLPGEASNEKSLTGAIRGTVATEQSVSELGGIFRGQWESLKIIEKACDQGYGVIVEMEKIQKDIEVNTRRTADNTDGVKDELSGIKNELKTIVKQTKPESYER